MASALNTTNVFALPTASRRHVRQPNGLAVAALSRDLPRHPAQWQDHGGGHNHEQVKFTRSPEMLVAMAVFKVMTDDQKARVRSIIGTMADMASCPHASTALAIVEAVA